MNNKIDWKLENSDKDTAVFYKLNDKDPNSYELLLSRLKDKSFSHLYVCTNISYTDEENISFLNFEKWSNKQSELLNCLYPIDNETKIIAITGTNGKTTTADFIRQICIEIKVSTLCIGTLGVWYNNKKEDDFGLTTPNYIDLRKYIHNYQADVVVFETSSHAIEQKRFLDLKVDSAAWTSFSQDHLDYHKTMDSYYQAKLLLKNSLKKENSFFYHVNDEHIHKDSTALTVSNIDYKSNKDFLKISYNKSNLDLAISCLENIGIKPLDSYEFLTPAPGRFNTYKYKDSIIIIDYAHTPDAVVNICKESKKTFNLNTITVFGCGGDRDISKRPLMGIAACKYSDEVIITSDNPRFEDPDKILKDITDGLSDFNNYEVIKDRSFAIETVIKKATKSLILILGKGHEPYLDIMGKKLKYSDIDTVMRYIND